MPRSVPLRLAGAILAASCATSHPAAPERATAPAPSASATSRDTGFSARTAGMERHDGLIPLYVDSRAEKLYLEIPRDSMRVLYFVSLATGLGSNPIGLDRGADVDSYVARFDRVGDRVQLVLENWNYRSTAADNPDHARTVRESFPPSTVAAMPILARRGSAVLVDATDFIYRDHANVIATLSENRQGGYVVARDRSSIALAGTAAFPGNTEIDVALTFALAGGRPGPIVSRILPDASALTLREHLSFVALPDDAYRPRAMDPRVGYFGVTFKDYAQPIQLPLERSWIARHRLERVDPNDPHSAIRNPIVYYVDRGIPEPIRSAVKEGVSWWVEAFAKAGLPGAFQVRDLPEGADPMDARYNVVQWENRNERGWSIGGSLGDPRTGEIIKGMARLDSHRERTDYNLYAGLMGAASSAADTAFVLARARQKAAHEVGHTLGLAHNFIASTYDRGSVMDYPPPRVRLDANGDIDVSQAYAVGLGPYDVWAIHWGYGIFPAATEQDSLRAIIAEGLSKGYLYLSDGDARPDYAADPRVNLWDDDSSASRFLADEMAVRRVALRRFGLRNIRPGEPLSLLHERFVPVYLMHRYAISALARTIGGMEYVNAVSGDGQQATRPIPAARQRAALHGLLAALDPAELAIPDTVLTLLGPIAQFGGGSPDLFASRVRPAFDELGAARTLAQIVVDAVLQRDRAGRVVQQAAAPGALTLGEVVDSLVTATWKRPAPASAKLAALQRVTQRALADRLLALAADTSAMSEVRAIAELRITSLGAVAAARARSVTGDAARAHWLAIAGDMRRWLERRELPSPTPALRTPPGDPIGEP